MTDQESDADFVEAYDDQRSGSPAIPDSFETSVKISLGSLRDLRTWDAFQKETRRQVLEEVLQVLTDLGYEYVAQVDKNMECGRGDAVRIGSLHAATVEAADRVYALINKPNS